MLGQRNKLPLRTFEPFRGDPLFDLWRAQDMQPFHSWADGEAAPEGSPLGSLVPEGQPLAIGRVQAAEFMQRARAKIIESTGSELPHSLGRCLEWDEPFYAVKVFGDMCQHWDVFTYANPTVGQTPARRTYPRGTRVLAADIMELQQWFPRDYGVVICMFVLEHVPDPHTTMRNVARILLPGGFLLVGAPFVDGVHACPDDYLRFTPNGLRRIVEGAGLEPMWAFSPGNPSVTAGDLLGMKSSYWPLESLIEESDSHPGNVFMLARKHGSHRMGPSRPNSSTATV